MTYSEFKRRILDIKEGKTSTDDIRPLWDSVRILTTHDFTAYLMNDEIGLHTKPSTQEREQNEQTKGHYN